MHYSSNMSTRMQSEMNVYVTQSQLVRKYITVFSGKINSDSGKIHYGCVDRKLIATEDKQFLYHPWEHVIKVTWIDAT